MISVKDKNKCYGCSACYSVCKRNAISMIEDEEGFYYPSVDLLKCVGCGICEKVCPYLNDSEMSLSEHSLYFAVQYKNEKKRMESTAGGFFSLVADYVLEQHGIVYGVGYEKTVICHKRAEIEAELEDMRGSKYVQSALLESFREICQLLSEKRLVLFVGTPCQVHGLKRYLAQEKMLSEDLITIDLICLGVSSPGIFKKWIEFLEKKYKNIVRVIQFRNKRFGYATSNVRVIFENDQILEQKYDTKAYIKTFFAGLNVRPSCYACKFRTLPRVSDFTIGDCIQIGDYSHEMNDDKGTTSVWAHTERARKIAEDVQGRMRWKMIEKNSTNRTGNPEKQMKIPAGRSDFFQDAQAFPYEHFIRKWVKDTLKSRCASVLRNMLEGSPFGNYIFQKMRRLQTKKFQQSMMQIQNVKNMER